MFENAAHFHVPENLGCAANFCVWAEAPIKTTNKIRIKRMFINCIRRKAKNVPFKLIDEKSVTLVYEKINNFLPAFSCYFSDCFLYGE